MEHPCSSTSLCLILIYYLKKVLSTCIYHPWYIHETTYSTIKISIDFINLHWLYLYSRIEQCTILGLIKIKIPQKPSVECIIYITILCLVLPPKKSFLKSHYLISILAFVSTLEFLPRKYSSGYNSSSTITVAGAAMVSHHIPYINSTYSFIFILQGDYIKVMLFIQQ